MKKKLLIVGAGLTGLSIAYLLREHKEFEITILEARDRLGGRIHTLYQEKQAPLEMGATWLGAKHTQLNELLHRLGLETFIQELGLQAIYEPLSLSPPQLVQLPPNSDPSFRIKGGTASLINALADQLDKNKIHFNEEVISIEEKEEQLEIKTSTNIFHSDLLVSTLPPYLFCSRIRTSPSLLESFLAVAKCTHTWMGESIKVALTYESPFWREGNKSGTIFSNVGPIPEMYDHSNVEDTSFALKGFFNGNYFAVSREERLALVMKQLKKYYGDIVETYLTYEELVWRNEPYTFAPYKEHILPHQNNGHKIFQKPLFNGRLYVAGSETADAFPGYMEGAIRSANFIVQELISKHA